MSVKIKVERDYIAIEGQTVYRPENMVPGDWLSFWDAAVSPVNYQEAFEAGAESVKDDLADEIKGLESEIYDLRSEITDLENEVSNLEMEVSNLEMEIERIKESEGADC